MLPYRQFNTTICLDGGQAQNHTKLHSPWTTVLELVFRKSEARNQKLQRNTYKRRKRPKIDMGPIVREIEKSTFSPLSGDKNDHFRCKYSA